MKSLFSLLMAVLMITGCSIPMQVATTAPRTATAPAAVTQVSANAERIATQAVWAQGELAEHFDKHPETYANRAEYDKGARDTIRNGVRFTYLDTQSRVSRVGYYQESTNKFTGMTGDERRITTHFQPDRGVSYVRGLPSSTYK